MPCQTFIPNPASCSAISNLAIAYHEAMGLLKKTKTVNFEGLPKQRPTVYLIVDVNEPIKILFWRFFSTIVIVNFT